MSGPRKKKKPVVARKSDLVMAQEKLLSEALALWKALGQQRARLNAAAPDLLAQLELALQWLDGILTDWPHEMSAPLNARARAARLPHIARAMDAMPNNWTGRDAMRAAIAKARGTP